MKTKNLLKQKSRTLNASTPEWNVQSFQQKFEKEVENRKKVGNSSQFLINNEDDSQDSDESNDINDPSGTFSQFLLIGIPPDADMENPDVKPQILIAYPPFEYPDLPTVQIIDSCFPTGPKRASLSRNEGSAIQDEFVFQFGTKMNASDKPTYGVCIHVSTRHTARPFYGSKNGKNHLYCFCLMTKCPAFSAHFTFLTFLALMTIGHLKKVHSFKELLKVNIKIEERSIDSLVLESQIGHFHSFSIPPAFQNELAMYYTYNINQKPEIISALHPTFMNYENDKKHHKHRNNDFFKYDQDDLEMELRFPSKRDIFNKAISWTCLDTLFSILPVSDILTILSGILLDHNILIIGSKLEEITISILAIQYILRPFNVLTTIPILPITSEHYLGLTDSPTPYLIGAPKCENVTYHGTYILVDLDQRSIAKTLELPSYPNHAYVESELTKYLNNLKVVKDNNEYQIPEIYSKTLMHKYKFSKTTCDEIIKIIHQPFENILFSNFICGFFVTHTNDELITIFNSELFYPQIEYQLNISLETLYETNPTKSTKAPPEEYEFWRQLIDSQIFFQYIEERLALFTEEKTRQHQIHQPIDANGDTKSIDSHLIENSAEPSDKRINLADMANSSSNEENQSSEKVNPQHKKTASKTKSLSTFVKPILNDSSTNLPLKMDYSDDDESAFDYSSDNETDQKFLKANNKTDDNKRVYLFESIQIPSDTNPRKLLPSPSKKVKIGYGQNEQQKSSIKKSKHIRSSFKNQFDSTSSSYSSSEEEEPVRIKLGSAKSSALKAPAPRKKSEGDLLDANDMKLKRKTLDPNLEKKDLTPKTKASTKAKQDPIRKKSSEEQTSPSSTKPRKKSSEEQTLPTSTKPRKKSSEEQAASSSTKPRKKSSEEQTTSSSTKPRKKSSEEQAASSSTKLRKKSSEEQTSPSSTKPRKKSSEEQAASGSTKLRKKSSEEQTSPGSTKPRKKSSEEQQISNTSKVSKKSSDDHIADNSPKPRSLPKNLPRPPQRNTLNIDKIRRGSGATAKTKAKSKRVTSDTDTDYYSDSEAAKNKLMGNDEFDYSSD